MILFKKPSTWRLRDIGTACWVQVFIQREISGLYPKPSYSLV